MRDRKRLSEKTDKRRRRKFIGLDGRIHWAQGKGRGADREVAIAIRLLKRKYGHDRSRRRARKEPPKLATGEDIVTIEELRASGYALAEAIKAHTDAVCRFLEEAQVDYQRKFGAVTAKEAAKLLSVSPKTIYAMTKDGRLAWVSERVPLWSIDELLRKPPAERRKKPGSQAYKPRRW